jgi:predicted enzyme related to lactoylglutathione lyase
VRLNYAIVFVSDMARSVAFYRDVIGLSLKIAQDADPDGLALSVGEERRDGAHGHQGGSR